MEPSGREIAALGANHDFVAGKAFCRELLDGGGDAAFASLEAVVDGCVDEIDAAFGGGDDRGGIACVYLRIGLTEISTDSERRHHEAMRFAEVAVGSAAGKSIGVALCALECGGFGHRFPYAAVAFRRARHAVPLRRRTVASGGFRGLRIQKAGTCP